MHTLALIENIFFLVLVAIVGLVRWIWQAAEARKNADAAKQTRPQPANVPPPRAPAQSEEERIRRFMEALGVPTSNAAPPKVFQPRQVAPKRPRESKRQIRPIDPFPRPNPRPWIPDPVVIEEPSPPVVVAVPPPIAETPLPARETTVLSRRSAPTFEIRQVGLDAGSTSTSTDNGWAARLANAQGLRDAIILREIFGPPRSMQEIGERK